MCELVEGNINTRIFRIAFLKYQAERSTARRLGSGIKASGHWLHRSTMWLTEHLNNQMQGKKKKKIYYPGRIWEKLFQNIEKHHTALLPCAVSSKKGGREGKIPNEVRITYYPVPFAIGSGSQALPLT